MDKLTMSVPEARNILEQGKNKYRAFERLAEALEVAVYWSEQTQRYEKLAKEAEAVMAEKKKEVAAIQAGLEAASEKMKVTLKELQDSVTVARQAAQLEREQMERDSLKLKRDLEMEKQKADAEKSSLLRSYAEKKNELENQYAEDRKLLESQLLSLESKKEAVQAVIKELQEKLAN